MRRPQACEDSDLLERFEDEVNDHTLFIGWHDYRAHAHRQTLRRVMGWTIREIVFCVQTAPTGCGARLWRG
jgi:hypothetical protein